MKSNELFNGLNGCQNVDRSEIIDIIELAKQENNTDVIYRLSKILNSRPDADDFNIEIVQFPETGLNGPRYTGDYREALDECGRLNKGYRFENGKVVKVAPKVKPIKKSEAKTPRVKKPASNYGKKSKRAKTVIALKNTKLQELENAFPELTKGSLYNTFSDEEKIKFIINKTTKKEETNIEKYDFIFEVTRNGYYIKSFFDLPLSKSVKNKKVSDSIDGLFYYNATEKGLEELKKSFPNNAYADRSNFTAKNLNKPTNKENFLKLVSDEKSNTLEKIKERKEKKETPAVEKSKRETVKLDKLQDFEIKIITDALNKKFGLQSSIKNSFESKDKNALKTAIILLSKYTGMSETFLHKHIEEIISLPIVEETPAVEKSTIKKPISKPKSNDIQLKLLGAKKTKPALKSPVQEKEITKPISSNPAVSKAGVRSVQNSEFYKVNGSTGEFLQRVEKKPKESVVITIDGEQGAGKTTMLYNYIEDFASAGNSSIFLTLEEHKDSELATEKVNKYLSQKAKNNLDMASDIDSIEAFYKIVACYDICFIDSWQKLLRLIGNIRLDEDLRKKFDGKVFVIIFQQTTTGRTKGGSEVVFDGDIIIKMVKENSFADNYAYFDKNRYTKIPIENIRYNIANRKVYNPNKTNEAQKQEVQPKETIQFSFNTK